jgi:hypothetical protein
MIIIIVSHSTTNFVVIGLAPAIGSLSSGRLAGSLDDRFSEQRAVNVTDDAGIVVRHCVGTQCFSYSLAICAGGVVTAFLAAFLLRYRRNRPHVQARTGGAH